jgi:hypothetical protein
MFFITSFTSIHDDEEEKTTTISNNTYFINENAKNYFNDFQIMDICQNPPCQGGW